MDNKPLVLVDPYPYTYSQIFTPSRSAWLEQEFEVIAGEEGASLDEAVFEKYLSQCLAIVGLMPMGKERLELAPKLKVIFNSGGNFKQNIDYEYCFDRRIHVLNCGPAYAEAVAELALGLALDLGRRISQADRDFRKVANGTFWRATPTWCRCTERRVGLVGFGSLGRALLPLLMPFRCQLSILRSLVAGKRHRESGGGGGGPRHRLGRLTVRVRPSRRNKREPGLPQRGTAGPAGSGKLLRPREPGCGGRL